MKLITLLALIFSYAAMAKIGPGPYIFESTAQTYMIEVDDQTNSEVSMSDFYRITSELFALYYTKNIDQRELRLFVDWKTPYFSAWATQLDEIKYQINFWGGFARIPGMLIESFEFVACHEIGHILGGHPRHTTTSLEWATSEGQSDHFAVTECLPKYYKHYKRTQFDSFKSLPYELDICLNAHESKEDQNICLKILRAGRGFADVLNFLYPKDELASFEYQQEPTEKTLFNSYPTPQCRIDIFKNGAECFSGNCKRNDCWYKSH